MDAPPPQRNQCAKVDASLQPLEQNRQKRPNEACDRWHQSGKERVPGAWRRRTQQYSPLRKQLKRNQLTAFLAPHRPLLTHDAPSVVRVIQEKPGESPEPKLIGQRNANIAALAFADKNARAV